MTILGWSMQFGNPKTAIVYMSIFAALLPHDIPSSLVYLRYKSWVDRTAGDVTMLLGLKLVALVKET